MKNATKTLMFTALLLLPVTGQAKEIVTGPIKAEVVDVIDGDTIRVKAKIWLGLDKTIKVKFNGVQAPELHRPKCNYERELAEEAKTVTAKAIAGRPVQLINVKYEKYSDRVLAGVLNHEKKNLNLFLFDQALAHPTETGKRINWCGNSLNSSERSKK